MMDVADTPIDPAGWADAIAARVNTFGLGLWFKDLEGWLGLDGQTWLPQSVDDGHLDLPVPLRGLQLRLYALDTYTRAPEPFRMHHIVLERAHFDARAAAERPQTCALPFGLDPRLTTPDSAEATLKPNEVATGRSDAGPSVSYFLDDHRVVGVDFLPGSQGIETVTVVRLGRAEPWG